MCIRDRTNLGRLLTAGAKVILRLPIIPGENDDEQSIAGLIHAIKKQDLLSDVHLMPYNRLAEAKYQSIGEPYPLQNLESPTPETLARIKERFEDAGYTVKIGG